MTSRAADALSGGMVCNSGQVYARTVVETRGRTLLQADIRHGEMANSNLLDASAHQKGDGGEVVTTASNVVFGPGSQVDTTSARGNTGNWLIGQTNGLTINDEDVPGGKRALGADMLMFNLAKTNITLNTLRPEGAIEQKDDIHVNADIRYDRNQLTLNAHRDIDLNAAITVAGTGTLRLNYGAEGTPDAPLPGSNLNVKPRHGQVDFERAGADLLRINGHRYKVIHDRKALQDRGKADALQGNYALGSSIDSSGMNFVPIASGEKSFTGTFDGLGHDIAGLVIVQKDYGEVGLFSKGQECHAAQCGIAQGQRHRPSKRWRVCRLSPCPRRFSQSLPCLFQRRGVR